MSLMAALDEARFPIETKASDMVGLSPLAARVVSWYRESPDLVVALYAEAGVPLSVAPEPMRRPTTLMFDVVETIRKHPDSTVSEIARRMSRSPTNVRAQLCRMRRRGIRLTKQRRNGSIYFRVMQ
jgi:hypothetical protein